MKTQKHHIPPEIKKAVLKHGRIKYNVLGEPMFTKAQSRAARSASLAMNPIFLKRGPLKAQSLKENEPISFPSPFVPDKSSFKKLRQKIFDIELQRVTREIDSMVIAAMSGKIPIPKQGKILFVHEGQVIRRAK